MAVARKLVLVVDDNVDHVDSIVPLLNAWAYNVITARTGSDAITSLRSNPPDLMLLDWMLPDMTGIEVLNAVRSDPYVAATQIVVLSGHPNEAEEPSLFSGVRFLLKSVAVDEIHKVVDDATSHRPLEILLADDMTEVGKAIAFGLRHHGIAVRQCRGGKECIDVFLRHLDTVDLVLLDVQMPIMDGPATLAALQQIKPLVRAAFITGHSGNYDPAQLIKAGALRVLQKPISPAVLARELVSLARGRMI